MKKVSLLMAAFALVLGFSQCSKKPVMPTYSGPVGDMILQDITLSATRGNGGGDSKVSVVDNNLQWDKEDVITVLDEDKTELGELHFVEYGKKDGVEDKTSAVFESNGPIPCPKEGKLTFTVGTVGANDESFQNQTGEGKSLYLTGEAKCGNPGNYSAEMKAVGYALLKLDMSAFVNGGTKDGAILMTIKSGEDVVSVTDIAEISNSVYVAVPAPVKERFYTITCNENKAVKNWKALEENTFYTKEGAAGEAIKIEPTKKEIPVAEPKGEPAATGVSLTYYIDETNLTEDGVVYSENEDMSEYKTAEYTAPGKGEQEHTVTLTGLTAGTTYYVRVYAKYNGSGSQETVYGEQTDFTTDIVPTTPKFTVGMDGDKPITVEFAPGNLQYLGKSDGTGTWRFAEHQWDYMGAGPSATSKKGNVDLGADYEGKYNTGSGSEAARDLFGWGCTGYEDTRKESHTDWYQKNYQPYSTSKSAVSGGSGINNFGYGPDYYSGSKYNLTVENKSDWGCLTIGSDPAGTWRTLSGAEWAYLFNTRMVNDDKGEGKSYRRATINSDASDGSKVYGLLLYPDGYTAQTTATSYTKAEWSAMESAGVVFLPAAGIREGTSLSVVGSSGYYWSSSCYSSINAYNMSFFSGGVNPQNYNSRFLGFSVRLVR